MKVSAKAGTTKRVDAQVEQQVGDPAAALLREQISLTQGNGMAQGRERGDVYELGRHVFNESRRGFVGMYSKLDLDLEELMRVIDD